MGNTSISIDPRMRLAGKWQVPAFAMAAAALVVVAAQVRSPARKIDIQTYLDLLSQKLNINLEMATIVKFNKVSERFGSDVTL